MKSAIKVGMSGGGKTEILEGLTAGETVVTGQTGGPVADGQEVEIVDRLPGEDD